MKFSTCTIASFGATIRKYATAFTRAGTLSFVITSCGGMFSVIVRRSTLTIRSMIGISRKRPGPFGSGSRRPSRKMMPRSYSRATLIAESMKSSRMTATTTTATMAAVTVAISFRGVLRSYCRLRTRKSNGRGGPGSTDDEREALDVDHLDLLVELQRLAVLGARLPELSSDRDVPVATDKPACADECLRPYRNRPAPHLHDLRERKEEEEGER